MKMLYVGLVLAFIPLSCNLFVNDVRCGNSELAIIECEFESTDIPWDGESPDGTVIANLLEYTEISVTNASGGTVQPDDEMEFFFHLERRGTHAIYRQNTAGGCYDVIEMPLKLRFRTNTKTDIDEERDVVAQLLVYDSNEEITIHKNIDLETFSGTYEPEVPENASSNGLAVSLRIHPDGGRGELLLLLEGGDGEVGWASVETQYYWNW